MLSPTDQRIFLPHVCNLPNRLIFKRKRKRQIWKRWWINKYSIAILFIYAAYQIQITATLLWFVFPWPYFFFQNQHLKKLIELFILKRKNLSTWEFFLNFVCLISSSRKSFSLENIISKWEAEQNQKDQMIFVSIILVSANLFAFYIFNRLDDFIWFLKVLISNVILSKISRLRRYPIK